MDYIIRKADERDKFHIARTIAYCFEDQFSRLINDMERVAKAFENGVAAGRFLVAEQKGEIIGVIACTDYSGRALYLTVKDCFLSIAL